MIDLVEIAIRDHECPKCGAKPGEVCRRVQGVRSWRDFYTHHSAHKARISEARGAQ